MSLSLSIVLPVYNEAGNILPLFEEIKANLDALPYTYEILYVDDASTDNSVYEIKSLTSKFDNVFLIEFVENCGQSAAFHAGFQSAKHEAIITLDADMQNDPKDFSRLIEEYNQGYDMVIGWRQNRQDTNSKKFASKIANSVRRKLTRDKVKDTGCSLKIMRSSMAKKLPLQFKGMHRFLVSLMQMEGAKISEIPVNHRERFSGTSKYNIWGRGIQASQDLLAVNWFFRRLKKYQIKEKR